MPAQGTPGWVALLCARNLPRHHTPAPTALTCPAKGHCQPAQPPLPRLLHTHACPWEHQAPPQAVYPAQNNPDYSTFRSGFGADTREQGMPTVLPTTLKKSIDSYERGTRGQGWPGSCSLFNSKTNPLKISSSGFMSWHTCPALCGLQGKQTARQGSYWKGRHQDINSDNKFTLSVSVPTFNLHSQCRN